MATLAFNNISTVQNVNTSNKGSMDGTICIQVSPG